MEVRLPDAGCVGVWICVTIMRKPLFDARNAQHARTGGHGYIRVFGSASSFFLCTLFPSTSSQGCTLVTIIADRPNNVAILGFLRGRETLIERMDNVKLYPGLKG